MEEFIDIPGFENLYSINRQGQIKSIRFNRILKIKTSKEWYPRTNFNVKGKKTHIYVHRLLALVFIPNPGNKPHINHINAIKYDNRLENLEWVTHKENMEHAFKLKLRKPRKKKNRLNYHNLFVCNKNISYV
jgi:hypothetical protein